METAASDLYSLAIGQPIGQDFSRRFIHWKQRDKGGAIMRRSWRGQGMTIHRRAVSRRGREAGEPGAVLTAVQTAFCLMVLLSVFTMQFVSGERFERLGLYFQAVMGREAAEKAIRQAIDHYVECYCK